MTTTPAQAGGEGLAYVTLALPCPLCLKVKVQPCAVPGEPFVSFPFIEGWGVLHPECGQAVREGRLQAQLVEVDAA